MGLCTLNDQEPSSTGGSIPPLPTPPLEFYTREKMESCLEYLRPRSEPFWANISHASYLL